MLWRTPPVTHFAGAMGGRGLLSGLCVGDVDGDFDSDVDGLAVVQSRCHSGNLQLAMVNCFLAIANAEFSLFADLTAAWQESKTFQNRSFNNFYACQGGTA